MKSLTWQFLLFGKEVRFLLSIVFLIMFMCLLKIYLFWKNIKLIFFNNFNILMLKIKKYFNIF
jgi:hypothetical protein